jgi:flagellum-specific peptidoglycan hydrolase FlgJ
MSLTTNELSRSSSMANNIGTHLVAKLEEISSLHGLMRDLSNMAPDLSSFSSMQSFVNLLSYVQEKHDEAYDLFHTYMLAQVVPIVGHINDRI